VDSAQIGVLKQTDEVSLTGLLESSNSSRLEPEISFEILSNFSHETLEGQLPDEELGRLLVSSDLAESDGSWPVSVGLLDEELSRLLVSSDLTESDGSWPVSVGLLDSSG